MNKIKNKLILIKGNNDRLEDFENVDCELFSSYLLNIDGIKILLSHGHELEKHVNHANIFIYGHEHIGYIKEENKKIYVCCGSISLPAENYKETYALLENNYIKVKTLDNKNVTKIKLN